MSCTYFILVPELIEGILVYVGRAVCIDAVLELERVGVLDLIEQVAYFLRQGSSSLEIEEVLLSHLFVLERLLEALEIINLFLRDIRVILRLLLRPLLSVIVRHF